MPVPAAIYYLDGALAGFTGMDGAFTATYSAEVATPSLTLRKTGYANLTVHDYPGGPLAMPYPTATQDAESATRSIAVTAPAGSATRAFVAVAVKRPGYAHAQHAAFKSVFFSEAGTGSVDVALPEGEATVVAYGFDGNLAGSSQAVASEPLSVDLKATPAFGAYRVSVPAFKSGSPTSVGYFLRWPSTSPIVENRIFLTILTGELLELGWGLPPVESFGIPGASYAAVAESWSSDGRSLLASRELRSMTPGQHPLAWLPQADLKTYHKGTERTDFYVNPLAPVPGANGLILELYDGNPVWRVIANQTSSASVRVPTFKPNALTAGKEYGIHLHAVLNHGQLEASERAVTLGEPYRGVYSAHRNTTSAYRTSAVAAESLGPVSQKAAMTPKRGLLERTLGLSVGAQVRRVLTETRPER